MRHGGDLLAFSHACALSPCEALLWSQEPQIQPWIEALQSIITRAREQQVADALSNSLEYLQTTLDSITDAAARLRTINSIIRLGQSILRATRPPTPRTRRSLPAVGRAGVGLARVARPARNAEHVPERSRVKPEHAAQRNTADSKDAQPSSTPPAEPEHAPEPDLSAEFLSANPDDPQPPTVSSIAEQEPEQTNQPFTNSNHQIPALADTG